MFSNHLASRKQKSATVGKKGAETNDTKIIKEAIEKYLKGDQAAGVTEAELPLPVSVTKALEKLFGKRIVGVQLDSDINFFNGVYIPENSDVIYVNTASDKPRMNDIDHAMRRDNPALYKELEAAMLPLLKNVSKYKAKLDKASLKETGERVTFDLTVEEMLACDYCDNQHFYIEPGLIALCTRCGNRFDMKDV